MFNQLNIKNVISCLFANSSACVCLDDTRVFLRLFDDSSKLAFSSLVFEGGTYIPKSVKQALKYSPPFFLAPFHTFVSIDETSCCVSLNYIGIAVQTEDEMKDLLVEFSRVVNLWRDYLRGQERKDLVTIKIKK